MKNIVLCSSLALLVAPVAASAADFNHDYFVGIDPQFVVTSGTPMGTAVSAALYDGFTGPGTFQTNYNFRVIADGIGSGSLATSSASSALKLTFSQVLFNGVDYSSYLNSAGTFFQIDTLPVIGGGVYNVLSVFGTVTGSAGGSFGGNATYIAAVPEPASWAMVIGGIGIAGVMLRRRRTISVRYA